MVTVSTSQCGAAWFAGRNCHMRRYQYTVSNAAQPKTNRQRGRASTSSGTSHMEYCGLHTLFVIMKASVARNATWPTRGVRGAAKMTSQAKARSAISSSTPVSRLRVSTPSTDLVGDTPFQASLPTMCAMTA